MDDEPLKNGEVWGQAEFPWMRGFVQWVTGDEWMFMDLPFPGRHGWDCSMPTSDKTGKVKYTQDELLERLRSRKYQPAGYGVEAQRRS